MSAGLPGVGLSGLFVLLTALLMPVVELARTVRGRSSLARWRVVGRHWSMAAAMVSAYVLVIKASAWVLRAVGQSHAIRLSKVTPLKVSGAAGAISLSLAVLVGLLVFMAAIARLTRPGQAHNPD